MTEIQQLEGEIKVLQAKLELLKEIETHKSPVEESYKDIYGVYPPTTPSVDNLETDDIRWSDFQKGRWSAFQKGWELSKGGIGDWGDVSRVLIGSDTISYMGVKYQKVTEPTKPMDEVVERLVKKYQAQKLWNIVRDELGFSIDMCDEIVDAVEKWLPKEQSAEGSQSVDTELLVDGFNHAIQKMKGMLR